MHDIPLNDTQRIFADKNHNLVYKFLHEKNLPASEYYDIVIFGYLRAVQRYLSEPNLAGYSFATVAWRAMEGEVVNKVHIRHDNEQWNKSDLRRNHQRRNINAKDRITSLERNFCQCKCSHRGTQKPHCRAKNRHVKAVEDRAHKFRHSKKFFVCIKCRFFWDPLHGNAHNSAAAF